MKIGITGSIASGKSEVTKFLKEQGFSTYDADAISKELTLKNNICYQKIIDTFGIEILDESLEINRKKLGEVVFNDFEKKEILENIIHPHVIKEIDNINDNLSFVEVPLLFEAKLEYLFDKIIVVSCDYEVELTRLMKRNNFSKEEAIKRMNSQMDIKIKEKKADYIIYNNGDIESLHEKIRYILKGII